MKNLGKKIFSAVLSTALVVTSVVGLTACGGNNNLSPMASHKESAKDVFSMAAVTSVNYLTGGSESVIGGATAQGTAVRPDGVTDTTVENLKTYLGMFNSMLSDGGLPSPKVSTPTAEEVESFGDYKTKISVTFEDKEYAIYYTEKGTTTNEEIDPEDNDSEIEEETKLEGVLVSGEDKFDVTGARKYEKETEEDGTEEEKSIEFTTTNSNGDKVTVKQKHETETENGKEETSTSYEYKIVNKDGTEYEYEIEWEVENNKTKMSVEIATEKDGEEVETEYEVECKDENNFVITQETENADSETELVIKVKKVNENEFEFDYGEGYDKETVLLNA